MCAKNKKMKRAKKETKKEREIRENAKNVDSKTNELFVVFFSECVSV